MASTSGYGERLIVAGDIYNALQVLDPAAVAGAVVVVVDDVFTTGNTLNAVARRLHEAGARAVRGLTLARQPWG
jgi:predicted amidophosphoribosyltransferase